ncbi:MAG: hypothetical protein HFI72_04695 [Peptococcaceae bacterium]|jgi:3-phosphoshikimate 1-carboxyvinyltransferase|nr:hypothetical protein [Peptococcaceae bacterium]
MEISIKPKILKGAVQVPSGKNLLHYYVLAAALSRSVVTLTDISFPQDVLATLSAIQKLGAKVQVCFADRSVTITGAGEQLSMALQEQRALFQETVVHCQDSGNTLRLCMPVFLLWGGCRFYGTDKLLERNQSIYKAFWQEQAIGWQGDEAGITCQGFLQSGHYHISNQLNVAFLIGMVYALAFAPGQSTITVPGGVTEIEYLQMSLAVLQQFGVVVSCENRKDGTYLAIAGNQQYQLSSEANGTIGVEGDYGLAAVYLAANAFGSDIQVQGLPALEGMLQPEKEIIPLLEQCKKEGHLQVDVSRIPYLVPTLVALASLRMGTTHLYCAADQQETYDRLLAMSKEVVKLGADIQIAGNGVKISGVPTLHGAAVDSGGDHRIAMALAALAIACPEPVLLNGAECVVKSYPDFWQQYVKLGGEIECISE